MKQANTPSNEEKDLNLKEIENALNSHEREIDITYKYTKGEEREHKRHYNRMSFSLS